MAVGAWIAHRGGLPIARLLDAVAPAIPVAFGGPTNLPWGLEIDPDRYADVATFHPTFLYEALWKLALAGLLIWVGRRFRRREGQLFTLYVAGYGVGRLWVEALRIDPASELLGLRVDIWTSLITIVVAAAVFVLRGGAAPRRARWRLPTTGV